VAAGLTSKGKDSIHACMSRRKEYKEKKLRRESERWTRKGKE
jgi:hypothetical protein